MFWGQATHDKAHCSLCSESPSENLGCIFGFRERNRGFITFAMGILRLLLFLFLSLLLVGFCQVESTSEGADVAEKKGEFGIVGDGIRDFVDAVLGSAPGVDTVYLFPRNYGKLVTAGEETEILVGINNEGESSIKVQTIKASIHFPFDHRLFVQNLMVQKTKRTAKVEVGTKNTDALNEWLQGTAFTQKLSNGITPTHKAKKKK